MGDSFFAVFQRICYRATVKVDKQMVNLRFTDTAPFFSFLPMLTQNTDKSKLVVCFIKINNIHIRIIAYIEE